MFVLLGATLLNVNVNVIAALVSGACVLVSAVITAYAAQSARYVSRALRVEITQQRLDAYKALWGHTQAGAAGAELDLAGRQRIEDDMFAWYFTSGNGIFLSDRSREVLVEVQSSLRAEAVPWATVVDLMSALRHSLREDVGAISSRSRGRWPWRRP